MVRSLPGQLVLEIKMYYFYKYLVLERLAILLTVHEKYVYTSLISNLVFEF